MAKGRGTTQQIPTFCAKFWTEGIERNKNYESIVTLGMRGDGDMPMVQGEAAANVALLEKIVADQRKIIGDHMNSERQRQCRRTGRSTRKCRNTTKRACAFPTT